MSENDDEVTVDEETIEAGDDLPEPDSEDQSAPPAAPAPMVDTNPLTGDPYEFEQCTISVQIILLPDDGDPRGREVVIGVRNHQDAPIIRAFRFSDVPLASPVTDLLEELRAELATRELAKQKRDAEAAAKPSPKPAPVKAETKPKPEPAKPVKVGNQPSTAQMSLFS